MPNTFADHVARAAAERRPGFEQPRTIEDLAAEAVRLGREVASAASTLGLRLVDGGDGVARSCLARWAAGRVLDERDEGALVLLAEKLGGEVEVETLGWVVTERGVRSNEHGEDCPILERVRVLTERGRRIEALQGTLPRFRAARAAVLDRIAAEREVLRLLGGG